MPEAWARRALNLIVLGTPSVHLGAEQGKLRFGGRGGNPMCCVSLSSSSHTTVTHSLQTYQVHPIRQLSKPFQSSSAERRRRD